MKKFLYPLFAVLTNVALVLGGFSFSAQQGRFCAFEVQCAEAAVPLTAPYIFGALLGCFGVSVAGYAGANGQDVETALNNAWDSFQAFATADVVQSFQESFALFTSPVMPVSALNISSLMYKTVAEWLLQSDYVSSSSVVYPDVVLGSISFPVQDYVGSVSYGSASSSNFSLYNSSLDYYYFSTADIYKVTADANLVLYYNNMQKYSSSRYCDFLILEPSGQVMLNKTSTSSSDSTSIPLSYVSYVSPRLARVIDPSYSPSASNPSVSVSNAVSGVPDSVSSAISSGSADAYGQAVEDAVSGQNINIDSATVENPAWSDVFGEIASTLESIQAAIESGFAGVLEGVQTFFRPVVEFFAPLDIRDSDDIGELVISNVSKEHTFTTKFPFCLVNDYKSLYQKAISPVGGSSGYPTPGHFVVKMPSMNGLNSEPITLDMTYIFTNKYMGLTLGQISQLFVAIACLAMFLHWVGDMINVVKSPNYGYVTVEGEAVGRGR